MAEVMNRKSVLHRKRMRPCMLVASLLLALPLLACGPQEPAAELSGEWVSTGAIYDAAATDIDGSPYLMVLSAEALAPGAATLHLLDAGAQNTLEETSSIETPLQVPPGVAAIVCSGEFVFTSLWGETDLQSALWVVNISNPAEPLSVTLLDAEYLWLWPILCGDYVVARTAVGDDFTVVDISDPEHPQKLADFEVDRSVHAPPSVRRTWATACADSRFFVLDAGGVTAFDMTTPSQPRQVSFYENPAWTDSGGQAPEDSLTTVVPDISDIANILEAIAPSGAFLGIDVSGDRAFVAASDVGLVILDVSDLTTIEEVASLPLPSRARRVVVSGQYAYVLGFSVWDAEGTPLMSDMRHPLYVVDISEPTSPELVATVDGITGIPPWQSVIAMDDTVFVTNNNTVHIIETNRSE